MGKTGKRNGCIKKFRFYPWINHGYIYEMIDHLCSCIAVLNTYVSIVLHDII